MFTLFYIALILALIHFSVKGIAIGLISIAFFAFIKSGTGFILSIALTLLFTIPFVRKFFISKPILGIIKKLNVLPKISETEQTALNAGTTWVESEFFKSKPDIEKILNEPYEGLTPEEQHFLDTETDEVCSMVSDWDVFQTQDLPPKVWQYLKDKRFFGMIIPKKYGGLDFSPIAQSAIIGKLATRSQVLSITTMVPNSLGPGELLLKYGTEKQKDYYLPRLADGRDIPCFGLTEPFAGSDAASIQSSGELFKDSDGTLKIRLNFEKRYITLGGVATVIGLAFQLKDPSNLMPDGSKTGITCALLNGDLPGITRGKRHMPMHIPFINSPLWGKDVIISVEESVIGGVAGLGRGWKMLMECLSVGRGISLPSISAAACKFATKVSIIHASLRKQFGVPIIKFEAIEEVIARMLAKTYMTDAMRVFTATAVKNGHKPAIVNAIIKYHATENSRSVVNDAMDILGGNAISTGPNNLLAHAYMGLPIGITVEGANIMTRSLLQFGQGLMRCHPFLYEEMVAIQSNDITKFDKNLWGHIGSFIQKRVRWFTLYFKEVTLSAKYLFYKPSIISKYSSKMERISVKFAFSADLILLLYGGSFKIREKLSSRFADIFSLLYIMSCTLKKFKVEGEKAEFAALTEYSLEHCLQEIDKALAEIYANLSYNSVICRLVKILFLLPKPGAEASVAQDKLTYKIVKNITENEAVSSSIFSHIYTSSAEDDRFKMMNEAFVVRKRAHEIFKKTKAANKKYDEALKDMLITNEEYLFITEWERIVAEVLQVDDFVLN